MPVYDFSQLSPHDFEQLIRDLLSAKWGQSLETFREGKDKGVDARLITNDETTIVQAKRYVHTPFSGLKSKLKKDEVPKIRKLNCNRYVLCTSLSLQWYEKDELANLFPNNLLKSDDVLGLNDINNLLGEFPEVEKIHFKLWIKSTTVLSYILNNCVQEQTKSHISEISESIDTFVVTSSYNECLDVLKNHNILFISGAPGVGKSTLADIVFFQFSKINYIPYVIEGSVKEGKNVFNSEEKQVFLFDDFLGSTYYGENSNLNFKELASFIKMIRYSKNKKFIFTTREHIFQNAIQSQRILDSLDLDKEKFVVHIEHLTRFDKANILYNHIFYGDLNKKRKNLFLEHKLYIDIIDSKNYTPRIVQWLTNVSNNSRTSDLEFRNFVKETITSPKKLWSHAYSSEISEEARTLIQIFWLNESSCKIDDLHSIFSEYSQIKSSKYSIKWSNHSVYDVLEEIENTFVKPVRENRWEFINPSVTDFVNIKNAHDSSNVVDLILCAQNIQQINRIFSFVKSSSNTLDLGIFKNSFEEIVDLIYNKSKRDRKIGNIFLLPNFQDRIILLVTLLEYFEVEVRINHIFEILKLAVEELESGEFEISDSIELYKKMKSIGLNHDFVDRLFELICESSLNKYLEIFEIEALLTWYDLPIANLKENLNMILENLHEFIDVLEDESDFETLMSVVEIAGDNASVYVSDAISTIQDAKLEFENNVYEPDDIDLEMMASQKVDDVDLAIECMFSDFADD